MKKIEVVSPFVGICHMAVCCEKETTDEEILDFCNAENNSGTTGGWQSVIRSELPEDSFFKGNAAPVACADDKNRLHILVGC